jgi:hypothetical protein
MNADNVYRDNDAENDEVYRTRHRRFAEECDRFEKEWGVSIITELDGVISAERLADVRSGTINVIPTLSENDLWAVLISLHFDLRYILWGRRQVLS